MPTFSAAQLEARWLALYLSGSQPHQKRAMGAGYRHLRTALHGKPKLPQRGRSFV